MVVLFKLEEYTFYYILRNFESLFQSKGFLNKFYHLPSIILDKFFNELIGFYGNVPDRIMEYFSHDSLLLRNICLNDNFSDGRSYLNFVKSHRFQSIELQYSNWQRLIYLMEFFQPDDLEKLSIHKYNIEFIDRISLFYSYNVEDNERVFTIPTFRNLKYLSVNSIDITDSKLFNIVRFINLLEYVDISNTNITDIRLLKKQKNLKHLDCTNIRVCGRNFIHLACFKNLKYLSFDGAEKLNWMGNSNSFIDSNINDQEKIAYLEVPIEFKSKYEWDFNEFINIVIWKDLEFLNVSKMSNMQLENSA